MMVQTLSKRVRVPPPRIGPGRDATEVVQRQRAMSAYGTKPTLTRVQTHKIHQTIAATRQTEARKFLANLS
jgi:hypothetical protein